MSWPLLTFLLIAAGLTSCGVPQEEFDHLAGQRDAAQQEIQVLQAELEAARREIQERQSELETARARSQTLQDDLLAAQTAQEAVLLELETAQSELAGMAGELERSAARLDEAASKIEGLESRMDNARTRAQVLERIFVPSLTGEIFQMSEGEASLLFLQWLELIDATGDPDLKQKFEALLAADFDNTAMTDFFIYAIESIPETLE